MYIWVRLGATVAVTENEAQQIFCGDTAVLTQKINAGEYILDGDSYIPECIIEECNEEHGWNYPTGDISF